MKKPDSSQPGSARGETLMQQFIVSIFKQIVRWIVMAAVTVSSLFGPVYKVNFTDKINDTAGLAAAEGKSGGLVVNIDINSTNTPFLNQCAADGNVSEAELYPYVDEYDNTQVTDLAFDIFCQYSATPSEIWTDSADKYLQTQENGTAVNYKPLYEGIYRFYQNNIDPYRVWFERCKTDGINAWLSLRMNDCHEPDEQASFLRSGFFYEAREKGWMIGSGYGYYRNCFDYSVPEVRRKMLDYMREQLLRYDVYGLELDWMREITCFDYKNNPGAAAVMNDFMRETNGIVHEAEVKWGHDIKIMARLQRDVEQCFAYGFDAVTWANEKLVDIIVVTPRWSSCDSALPVADWAAKCGGVEIYAGIETLVLKQTEYSNASAEVVKGFAAQYLTAGADKIYLYNYYQNPFSNNSAGRNPEIFAACGQLATVLNSARRHIVTYQDTAPDGYESYKPLPLKITSYNTQKVNVETGYIPENAGVTVILGTKTPDRMGKIKLFANGTICKSIDSGTPALNAYADDGVILYKYEMTNSNLTNLQKLAFENTGISAVEIDYAEIVVEL